MVVLEPQPETLQSLANQMPLEIWDAIAKHIVWQQHTTDPVPVRDITSLCLACKDFNQTFRPFLFPRVTITRNHRIRPQRLQLLARWVTDCPAYKCQLREVIMEGSRWPDEVDEHLRPAFDILKNLQNLESLTLRGSYITPHVLSRIYALKSLQRLELTDFESNWESILDRPRPTPTTLPVLRHLRIQPNEGDDENNPTWEDLAILAFCPTLEYLAVGSPYCISEVHMRGLFDKLGHGPFTSLTTIKLSNPLDKSSNNGLLLFSLRCPNVITLAFVQQPELLVASDALPDHDISDAFPHLSDFWGSLAQARFYLPGRPLEGVKIYNGYHSPFTLTTGLTTSLFTPREKMKKLHILHVKWGNDEVRMIADSLPNLEDLFIMIAQGSYLEWVEEAFVQDISRFDRLHSFRLLNPLEDVDRSRGWTSEEKIAYQNDMKNRKEHFKRILAEAKGLSNSLESVYITPFNG